MRGDLLLGRKGTTRGARREIVATQAEATEHAALAIGEDRAVALGIVEGERSQAGQVQFGTVFSRLMWSIPDDLVRPQVLQREAPQTSLSGEYAAGGEGHAS